MTAEEEQFVDDRIKESHEKLKGLVTVSKLTHFIY